MNYTCQSCNNTNKCPIVLTLLPVCWCQEYALLIPISEESDMTNRYISGTSRSYFRKLFTKLICCLIWYHLSELCYWVYQSKNVRLYVLLASFLHSFSNLVILVYLSFQFYRFHCVFVCNIFSVSFMCILVYLFCFIFNFIKPWVIHLS